MARYPRRYYINMNKPVQPVYVLIPVEDIYDNINEFIEKVGDYDYPFSIKTFVDFMMEVVGSILPTQLVDYRSSAIYHASLLVGNEHAIDTVDMIGRELMVQMKHLQLPSYPVSGYEYRFHITGDLNLHLYYESTSPPMNLLQTHTRDDILACINNGDYISEKLRRNYGI